MSGGFDWCGLRGTANDDGSITLRDYVNWPVVHITGTPPVTMSYPVGNDGLYDADGPNRAHDFGFPSTGDALDAVAARMKDAAKARTQRAR